MTSVKLFAADASNWRLRRMTALDPGVKPESKPRVVSPASLDVELVDMPRPRHWRFAAAPIPERDPRHVDFRRYRADSHVLSSDASVDNVLDVWGEQYGKLEKALPPLLATTELPSWKKGTIQTGTLVYWWHGRQGVSDEPRPLPADLLNNIRRVLMHYRRVVDREGINPATLRPDPSTTNAGAPVYVAGPAAKYVSALLVSKRGDWQSSLELAQEFNLRVGLPAAAAWAFALGGRSGPSYKWQDRLRFDGTPSWVADATWRGYYQRNRVVQMAPYGANMQAKPFYACLQTGRRGTPGAWHGKGTKEAFRRPYAHAYEADISGFDRSVTPELQDAFYEIATQVFPEIAEHIEWWREMERRPLITPNWSLLDGLCTLVFVLGSTKSGLKLTTEAGTLYTLACALTALERQGFNVDQWPNADDFITFHSGDDVRLSTDRPVDAKQWQEDFKSFNLDCELLPGHGFLSRHLSHELFDVPIAGRIVQQTVSNEHEPRGPDSLGLVYLGFLARSAGAERLPKVLQDAVWSVVRECEWVKALPKASSLSDFRQFLVTNPVVKSRIRAALVARASESWYVQQRGAADHSVTSALAVEYADAFAPELGARIASLDATLAAAVAQSRQLDDGSRLARAVDGYNAIVNHGTEAGLNWYYKTTGALHG